MAFTVTKYSSILTVAYYYYYFFTFAFYKTLAATYRSIYRYLSLNGKIKPHASGDVPLHTTS